MYKTLADLPDIKGKKVLLRVDFNVPTTENGEVKDDTRIKESLPTIQELQKRGARIIIVSHLGRPKGHADPELSLKKVAAYLEEMIGSKVRMAQDVCGDNSKKIADQLKDGEIMMLENVRFRAEEEECTNSFSKQLAELADIYVNDAFGTAHRRHASTAGVADHIPAYAGLLMQKEIEALTPIIASEPRRPLVMIFGGAKIDTKIGVIKNFVEKADYFLIGGAIANTFLQASGYNVGESLVEEDKVELAREIMMECQEKKTDIILPHDLVVASDISENAQTAHIPVEDVIGDMKILDIGKWTAEKFCNVIDEAGTVIWNGPLGYTELPQFSEGSETVARFLAKKQNLISIIGGGDTADMVKRFNIPPEAFTHISTGGGACIEFLEGKSLPGIEVLKK